MYKGLLYLAFFSGVFQASFAEENDLKSGIEHSKEKLTVAVKIIEEEDAKTDVLVNLKVTIEEDNVKVNGKLTELDVLIKYELDAEIEYSPTDIRISPVIVHVIVTRKELKNGHRYLIEEQVQFIEGKKVEQLDVQVLTIHMDIDGKEYKRTTEIVSFEESRIKNTDLSRFCGPDDPMPVRTPNLPNEKGQGDRHHGHHHGKSFCTRFHKLPFGARIAILIGLVFVVLASVMCCAMCCCRKSKSAAYHINKDDDFKAEFDMDDSEAEPLPEKLAFDDDKQVLIA